MADPISEARRTQSRFIDRVRESWQAATGIEMPSQYLLPGNPGGAFSGEEPPPDTFSTGYDGSETTTAFMFNVSLFGGDDVLS